MDIEYVYAEVNSGKVWSVNPESPNLPPIQRFEEYPVLVNRLYEAGWEPTNPKFDPGPFGTSLIRFKRQADFVQPQPSPRTKVEATYVELEFGEDFDAAVKRIRRLWEVNGWDLIRMWQVGNTPLTQMFFSKPTSAPDVAPFVDPNK